MVATPGGARRCRCSAPAEFRARTFSLAVGGALDREALLEPLERAGYERVDTVVEVGQWSLRGGIVDVFSPTHERPVRAEFFGDEVESLRLFDPTTQRSVESLDELVVLPLGAGMREAPPSCCPPTCRATRSWCSTTPRCSTRRPTTRRRPSRWRRLLVRLPAIRAAAARSAEPGRRRASPWARARWAASGASSRSWPPRFAGWRAEGFAVRLVVDDERQAERLRRILPEHELEPWPGATLWSGEGLGVVVGECAAGFQLPALGLVVLTEEEVFGARRRRLRRPVFQRGAAIAAFTDLAPTTSSSTRSTASAATTASGR